MKSRLSRFTTAAAGASLAVLACSRQTDGVAGGAARGESAAAAAVSPAATPATGDSNAAPPTPRDDRSAISVFVRGGVADVVVTDPLGRRLGVDPVARHRFAEIPRGSVATAEPDAVEEDDAAAAERPASGADSAARAVADAPVREVMILSPAPGTYTLSVAGSAAGAYDLDVGTVAGDAASSGEAHVVAARIAPGAVHRYTFLFAAGKQPRTIALTRRP
ncbi:MAG TPA: hypothetical protein VFJ74_07295 [Gemmatimonadaceae bacterium]|nr:hypothetical protein [Gemmatimonadaceae bacterium]